MDIEEFYNSVPNHGAKYNELIKYIKEELDKINPDFELSVATYRAMKATNGTSKACSKVPTI